MLCSHLTVCVCVCVCVRVCVCMCVCKKAKVPKIPDGVNETEISVEFDGNYIINQCPLVSDTITHTLTNTKWQLCIENSSEWLGVFLQVIDIPELIESMHVRFYYKITENINDKILHALCHNRKYTKKDNDWGSAKFLPLKMIQNCEKIQIQCWFIIEKINDKSLFNDSTIQALKAGI